MHSRAITPFRISSALAISVLSLASSAQRSAHAHPSPQEPQRKLPASPVDKSGVELPGIDELRARLIAEQGDHLPQPRAKRDTAPTPPLLPPGLYFSQQPDGSPQVYGTSFKAEFTRSGAAYIPFLGAEAPCNYPLTLTLAGLTVGGEPVAFDPQALATLADHTVVYARGDVRELYVVGEQSVEQQFVLDAPLGEGQLVLHVGVATELERSVDGQTLVFGNELGGVRYGAATVIDAHGQRAAAPTEFEAGGISITVPAEFLASAAFPVTVDPVIDTFVVGPLADLQNANSPAVAFDRSTKHYGFAYARRWSSLDFDVLYAVTDTSGNFVSGGTVDSSLSQCWADPDIANNNAYDNFLVVAEVGSPGDSPARVIRGRLLDAHTCALGSDILISVSVQSGDKSNPSVGGDPFVSDEDVNYAVVWQRRYSATDRDIHARYVTPTGSLVGNDTLLIDDSGDTLDENPRISKSCEEVGIHHVVWQRQHSTDDRDIYGATLDFEGNITTPSTPITTAVTDTTAPYPSSVRDSSPNRWVLVYEVNFLVEHDIFVRLMNNLNTSMTADLSAVEALAGSGSLLEDQRNPVADSDGLNFAVAYSESFGFSSVDYDIYASTIKTVVAVMLLGESHRNLAFSTTHENYPAICSTEGAGGPDTRTAVCWSDSPTAGGFGTIEAGLYDIDIVPALAGGGPLTKFCSPGVDGVAGCPCGNPPIEAGRGCDNSSTTGGAAIFGEGTPSLASDTLAIYTSGQKPTGLSFLTQGSSVLATGATFGQGVRCVQGSAGVGLKRLYSQTAVEGTCVFPDPGISGPSISARSALAGDPLNPGDTRHYFVYYRDSTVPAGCPAASTFNTTDSGSVTWEP